MTRVALALILLAGTAEAQTPCPHIARWADKLEGRYGETMQGRGVYHDGKRVLMIFANPETGSWTVLLRDDTGAACLVAHGDFYERIDAAAGPMGSDG